MAEDRLGTRAVRVPPMRRLCRVWEGNMAEPRIVIYQDEAGGFAWHLKAGNGEIVAQGESHTTEADARRAALRAGELLSEAGETLSFEAEQTE